MKQVIIYTVCTLIACACNESGIRDRHTAVSAIVDITDKRVLYPTPSSIIPLFGLGTDESQKATFRLSTLSDRELAPDIEIRLASGTESDKENINEDIHFRKRQIVVFYKTLTDTIASFVRAIADNDSTLDHSECFKGIAGELAKLVAAKADKGVLLVFSDVQENSVFFNCYDKASQDMLSDEPQKVVDIFERTKLLPLSLNNITVIFVYAPVSRDDDARFMRMVSIYRTLIEKRGATVHITAQNQNYQL